MTPPLFPQPAGGAPHKWWCVEIRFDRPLKKGTIRLLSDAFRCEEYRGQRHVGTDGALLNQWYNSFPGGADAAVIFAIVRRVGAAARVRAAPYGRDCPNHPGCVEDPEEPPPEVGSSECSCNPHFTDADWLRVNVVGKPEGWAPCPACQSTRARRKAGVYTHCSACDSSGWRRPRRPVPSSSTQETTCTTR